MLLLGSLLSPFLPVPTLRHIGINKCINRISDLSWGDDIENCTPQACSKEYVSYSIKLAFDSSSCNKRISLKLEKLFVLPQVRGLVGRATGPQWNRNALEEFFLAAPGLRYLGRVHLPVLLPSVGTTVTIVQHNTIISSNQHGVVFCRCSIQNTSHVVINDFKCWLWTICGCRHSIW